MQSEYAQKANVGVICGVFAQNSVRPMTSDMLARMSLSRALGTDFSPYNFFVLATGLAMSILGTVLFVWGCQQYAKAKGQSEWFGVLGVVSLVGLLVIALLPDKHKQRF